MKRQQIILASLNSLTHKYDESWDKTLSLFHFSTKSLSTRVQPEEIVEIAYALKEDLDNV